MKTPAWQRSEGKNPKGGLNAKGRASYNAQTGGNLKAPVKSGYNPRRASFLARMGNMAGAEYKDGEPTRLLLSLKAWGASSKADAKAKARAISERNKAKAKLEQYRLELVPQRQLIRQSTPVLLAITQNLL